MELAVEMHRQLGSLFWARDLAENDGDEREKHRVEEDGTA